MQKYRVRRMVLAGNSHPRRHDRIALQPSPALEATGRSDAGGTYACGSGTFTCGKKTLKVAMSVTFPCNKGLKLGEIRVVVTGTDGIQQIGTPHVASKCGKYTLFSNLSWSQKANIKFFHVETRSTKGQSASGYHRYNGNVVDNPLT